MLFGVEKCVKINDFHEDVEKHDFLEIGVSPRRQHDFTRNGGAKNQKNQRKHVIEI